MTWIGLVLLGIGMVDLARWDREDVRLRTGLACLAFATVAAGVLWQGGIGARTTVVTVVLITATVVAWALTTQSSRRDGGATLPGLLGAIAILGGALLVSPYSPDVRGRLQRWYESLPLDVLDGVPVERAILVVGCGIALIGSGNVVVRLVLTAAGSRVSRSEQQIKGGRVLGPMERLLVFGLGLAGELAAASIIVAAKGLLRFPELQSYQSHARREGDAVDPELPAGGQRIDVLTEYFLIGSMTSWLLALGLLLIAGAG